MSEQKSYQKVIVNGETVVDFAKANLNYYDVTTGKPFYNNLGQLEVGALRDSTESFKKSIESSSVDIIVIPENTLKVRANCFSDSSVGKVILPEGLISVGSNAFKNTSSWATGQKLRTCKTLTEIQSNAFNFYNLTGGVFLPSTLSTVGSQIFGTSTGSNCIIFSELKEKPATWADDWNAQNRPVVWNYPENTKGTDNYFYHVIDNLIYKRGSETDRAVTVLGFLEEPISTELIIPDYVNINGLDCAVMSMADDAFAYETKLEKVVLGSQLIAVSEDAFYGCKGIKEFDLSRCRELATLRNTLYETSVVSVTLPACLQELPTGFSMKMTEIYNLTKFELTNASLGYGTSVVIHTDPTTPSIVEQIDDFVFAKHPDGYALVDYRGTADNISLPKTCKGNSYRIGPGAFWRDERLKKVTISSGVTAIDFGAFTACPNLLEVYIEDGLTAIGSWCFASNTRLKSLRLPSTVKTISDSFYGCSGLVEVILPDSLEEITETAAFCSCEGLRTISLGKHLRNLPEGTFAGCTSLTTVKIPQDMVDIKGYAFSGCYSLTNFEIDENNPHFKAIDGNIYSTDEKVLVMYAPGKKDIRVQLTNPNVETIGKEAFANNNFICVLELPQNTKIIEEDAFMNAVNLGHVTCPDGLLEIKDGAFQQCYELQFVNLGKSLISIGESAFSSDSALFDIKIPDTVEFIGQYAFLNANFAVAMNLYDGIYYVGNETNPYVMAYKAQSSGGTSLTLKEGTRIIYDGCFGSNTQLTELTIPDSVRYISGETLGICENLTTINVNETNPYLCVDNGILYNKAKTALLKYNCGSTLTEFMVPPTVTEISARAFYGAKNLIRLIVSEQVTTIGKHAFGGCTSLTTVTFSDCAVELPEGCFLNSTALSNLYLGNNITRIEDIFGWNTTSISTLVIPASVTYIYASALTKIATIYMCSEIPCQLSYIYNSGTKPQNIYVPTAAAVTAYKNASNWSIFAAKIKQGVPA